jgi:hypothetical protein
VSVHVLGPTIQGLPSSHLSLCKEALYLVLIQRIRRQNPQLRIPINLQIKPPAAHCFAKSPPWTKIESPITKTVAFLDKNCLDIGPLGRSTTILALSLKLRKAYGSLGFSKPIAKTFHCLTHAAHIRAEVCYKCF